MSHFYGTVQDACYKNGQATRRGFKFSGIKTECASWGGAVECYGYYDEDKEQDMVRVKFIRWHGRGADRVIYDGPIDGTAG